MPFCPNCGTNSEGRFCAKCGTPIPVAAEAPPPPPPAAGYVPPAAPYVASSGLQDNIASALCYIPFVGWIVAIIFLVIDPYRRNRTIRFHAFQSIFLFVALMIVWFVLRTMASIIFAASFAMWSMFSMLILLFDLAVLALLLFLMFKAYNNQRFPLPIIGPLADKQA